LARIAWLFSLLGLLGIVAAIALLRSAVWAAPAAVVVGVVNLIGAVVALVQNWDGAIIGLASAPPAPRWPSRVASRERCKWRRGAAP
jgi:hypothetical protein